MYYINTHNFGFAAPHGCIALTRVSDGSVDDGDLVIALHGERIYARRLLRNEKRPDIVVLGSEAEDPSSRPGSLVLPAGEVRLLRVTGILFSNEPDWSRSSEEAHPVDQSALFESVRLAYRVTGESALPLAIKGQVLLGGDDILPDRLGDHENALVTVVTTDDEAFFKRVGKPVPSVPHARFFESVGGRGDSTLVRTEDVADSLGDVAVLRSARRVVGILYEPSRTR